MTRLEAIQKADEHAERLQKRVIVVQSAGVFCVVTEQQAGTIYAGCARVYDTEGGELLL